MTNTEKLSYDFKSGDLVRIVKLDITEKRHGTNRHMEEMIGKEFFIEERSSETSVRIRDDKNKTRWAFSMEDLELVKDADLILSESMPTEPIMFDPKDL